MRIIGLDPAGKKFGIAGVEFIDDTLSLYLHHLVESPDCWKTEKRNLYCAHLAACVVALDKPDVVVSENPWGIGFSKSSLANLLGSIRAELWQDIEWQGVSEARRAVLGDGYGGAKKIDTANWLLEYPWDIKSKNILKKELETANPETDEGFDILDSVLHILCFLIVNHGLQPKHKPPKQKKSLVKKK